MVPLRYLILALNFCLLIVFSGSKSNQSVKYYVHIFMSFIVLLLFFKAYINLPTCINEFLRPTCCTHHFCTNQDANEASLCQAMPMHASTDA